MVRIYNGISLGHKKEHIWVSSNEVDEPRAYYTEWSKSEREKQILYINTYTRNLGRWYGWTYLQGYSGDTSVLLPGKSHGRRSLVGCSPWGREESDMTERVQFHFSLSCIGAGSGNPLQRSCLENPRDGGAWWAAVYGVAQSRTWLKWLSSSSSIKGKSL